MITTDLVNENEREERRKEEELTYSSKKLEREDLITGLSISHRIMSLLIVLHCDETTTFLNLKRALSFCTFLCGLFSFSLFLPHNFIHHFSFVVCTFP